MGVPRGLRVSYLGYRALYHRHVMKWGGYRSPTVMPGNVFLPAVASGLPKDSVVNVTALVTLDKIDLEPPVAHLPTSLMSEVDRGLHRVLGL